MVTINIRVLHCRLQHLLLGRAQAVYGIQQSTLALSYGEGIFLSLSACEGSDQSLDWHWQLGATCLEIISLHENELSKAQREYSSISDPCFSAMFILLYLVVNQSQTLHQRPG